MSNPDIKISKLSKSFKSLEIFKEVSFDFYSDKINLIVGRNGIGKSTLLKIISDEINEYSGKVSTFDENIFYLPVIPSIFQFEKVINFINFISKAYGEKFKLSGVDDLIGPILDKKMRELSTGEIQKTILTCSFASGAKIVLLDEPTNGIDEDSKKFVFSLFQKMIDRKRCLIVSTHLLNDFHELPHRKIVIDNKKLKEVDQLKSDRVLISISKNNQNSMEEILQKLKVSVNSIDQVGDYLTTFNGEFLKSADTANEILKEIVKKEIVLYKFETLEK